ncbi:uncharacterized protein [Phyllobates terribilis]|uniref:uncharacterized protein n=1 Tax=Phyllobates terribilis TaxID=111132 RepID=UPI003CCAFD3E
MSTKGTVDPSVGEAHHVPDTTDVPGAESTLTAEQDVRPKRVTKPTQKVRENLETTRNEFPDNIDHLWGRVDHYLAALPRANNDAADLTAKLKSLSAAYDRYQRLSVKYIAFQRNCDMDDAPAELAERETLLQEKTAIVREAQDKAELRIAHLQEVRSHRTASTKITSRSSRSSQSKKSTLSDKILEIRASAEEARVRSSFARKEAELEAQLKKQEAQLKMLQTEREEAATLAKLKVLEQALSQDANMDCFIPGEMEDPADRTTDYVLKHLPSVPAPPPIHHTDAPVSQEMSPPTADKVRQ